MTTLSHYCDEMECVIFTPIAERDDLSVTGWCGHCQSRIVAYINDAGELVKYVITNNGAEYEERRNEQ